ncbi:MAG: hypothetical protein OXE99_07530 [Cellvibrionales bacterium]|nr:hypothetical protein [Cellvibrionales bacterium]
MKSSVNTNIAPTFLVRKNLASLQGHHVEQHLLDAKVMPSSAYKIPLDDAALYSKALQPLQVEQLEEDTPKIDTPDYQQAMLRPSDDVALLVVDTGFNLLKGADELFESLTALAGSDEEETKSSKEEDDGINWKYVSIALGALGAIGVGAALIGAKDDDKAPAPTVEPSNTETLDVKEQVLIKGQAMLGPVVENNGLSIQILSVNNELLGTQVLNAKGEYLLSIDNPGDMVKVRLVDTNDSPDYIDEATGQVKDLSANLFTVISLTEGDQLVTAHVNPLTTMASRMMGFDADGNGEWVSSETIKQVNSELAENLLGNANIDLASYHVQPMIDADGNILTANEGGQILGLISAMELDQSKTTAEVLTSLVDSMNTDESGDLQADQVRQLLSDASPVLLNKYGEKVLETVQYNLDRADALGNGEIPKEKNVAPNAASTSIEFGEDKTHQFTLADFSFSDENSNDNLQSITIKRLPTDGYLRLNGETVTESITVSRNDISKLTYKGRADDSGTSYSVLTFTVNDGELDSRQHTIIFDVNAVNDAPELSIEEKFDSLFGEVRKISTSSGGNQNDPDLIALDNGSFITVWDDNEKEIKAQKYQYSEDFKGDYILVKQGDEFRVNTEDTTDNQKLYNPEIAADAHGDFAVQWWRYEQGASTTSYVAFFDEEGDSTGPEQELGLQYLTKSIISLNSGIQAVGYIAVGFVKNGEGSHFGVNLYDEGEFVKTIKITGRPDDPNTPDYDESVNIVLPDFGTHDFVLTPLSYGGFAGTFRITSPEVNQVGFAYFDHEGNMIPQSLVVQDSELGADEKLEMVELNDGTLAIFNKKGADLVLQGWKATQPVFVDLKANEKNAVEAENTKIIALDDGGFFTLWSLPNETKGDAIIGRYFDATGKPLTSEIEIFHIDPQYHFGGVSIDQLSNGRLQVAWSDDREGTEDIYMMTLNLDKLQHNLQDQVVVGQASAEDVEGGELTFSLKDDSNGLFTIDADTGVITVLDPAGIRASDDTSFTIDIQVEDDEGEVTTLEHMVKFPGSIKEEETIFVLTEQQIDISDLGDASELTLQDLIDLGIIKVADEGLTSGPSFRGSDEYIASIGDGTQPIEDYSFLQTVTNIIG